MFAQPLYEKFLRPWTSAAGGRGAVAHLDFHTWYTDIVDKGLIVLFFGVFLLLSVFFSVDPEEA